MSIKQTLVIGLFLILIAVSVSAIPVYKLNSKIPNDVNMVDYSTNYASIKYLALTKDLNLNYYAIVNGSKIEFENLPPATKLSMIFRTDINAPIPNNPNAIKWSHTFTEPNGIAVSEFGYNMISTDILDWNLGGETFNIRGQGIDLNVGDIRQSGYTITITKNSDYNYYVAITGILANQLNVLDPVLYVVGGEESMAKSARQIVRTATNDKVWLTYTKGDADPTDCNITSSDTNGSTWNTAVKLNTGTTKCYETGIDVNSTNGLHVVYRSGASAASSALFYRTCSVDCNLSINNWSSPIIITNDMGSAKWGMDVDGNNGVKISYLDTVKNYVMYRQCLKGECQAIANWDANTWLVSATLNAGASPAAFSIDTNSTYGNFIWLGDNLANFLDCGKACDTNSNWRSNTALSTIAGINGKIVVDSTNKVWIVTDKNLFRFNGDVNLAASLDVNQGFDTSTANQGDPDIAYDKDGNVYVVWRDSNNNINYRRRTSAGNWDAKVRVATQDVNYGYRPTIRKTATIGNNEKVDWAFTMKHVVDNNYAVVFDTNMLFFTAPVTPANNAIDVNVVKIDGNADNGGLPRFFYNDDKNITIDFNVYDADCATGVCNNLDANIDYRDVNGQSYRIITNLELTTAGICNDTDFASNDNNIGTTCRWDWNNMNVPDSNFFIDVNVTDNNTSQDFNRSDQNFRAIPFKSMLNRDINVLIAKIDGNVYSSVISPFSYARDKNLTIDFNVYDADCNGNCTNIDANIDYRDVNGQNYRIITNLELTTAGRCNDSNFANDKNQGTTCHWDWNIINIGDRNFFIDINVTDNNSDTDSNSFDKNFLVDNIAPSITIRQPVDGNLAVTTNTIAFDANDSHSIALSNIRVDINSVTSNNFATSFCTNYDKNYYCTYQEGDINKVTDYNISVFALDLAGNIITKQVAIRSTITLTTNPSTITINLGATGTTTRNVIINNIGDLNITSLAVTSNCTGSLMTFSPTTISQIDANGSSTVVLTFTPAGSGAEESCSLTITDSNTTAGTSIAITDSGGASDPTDSGGTNKGGGPGEVPKFPTIGTPGDFEITSITINNVNYNVGDAIRLMVPQGTIMSMKIKVKNKEGFAITAFEIAQTPEIAQFITILPTANLFSASGDPMLDTTIDSASEKEFVLNISVPANAMMEEIPGTITFKSGDNVFEQPIVLQIVSRTALSDLETILKTKIPFLGNIPLSIIAMIASVLMLIGTIDSGLRSSQGFTGVHILFVMVFLGVLIGTALAGGVFAV